MNAANKYIVQIRTEKLESGLLRPWVSVIRQEGRRYSTVMLELEDELFYVEGGAVQYAKKEATRILKEWSPLAEISFNVKKRDDKKIAGYIGPTDIARYPHTINFLVEQSVPALFFFGKARADLLLAANCIFLVAIFPGV